MDKEAKEVLVIFASIAFMLFVFFKLMTMILPLPTQTIGIKNETVANCHELKKQRETLDEIKKQNKEIIKLLKKK